MIYYKKNNRYEKFEKNVGVEYDKYLITKAEYDKAVTIPTMSNNNVLHNYFNGAEQGLKLAKSLYLEHLESAMTQDTVKETKQLRSDFIAYEEALVTVSFERAIKLYESELAGNTEEVAIGKATAVVIDENNLSAIAGRDAFLKWAIVKFPQLRTYLDYVNSLKYSTTLTEDEPEDEAE